MIEPKYLVIMPKEDSYSSMSEISRLDADKTIKDVMDFLDKFNMIGYAIAEDVLAYQMLRTKENVTWISTLTKMDSIYLANHSDIYAGYIENSGNKYRKDLIDNVAKRIKKPETPENASTNVVYMASVVKSIFSRIRACSGSYITAFGFVVYFKKGPGYVRAYEPKIGDKKIYVEVELDTGLKQCYLGGSPISFDDLDKILGGVL